MRVEVLEGDRADMRGVQLGERGAPVEADAREIGVEIEDRRRG
jgi:hypothetical protein